MILKLFFIFILNIYLSADILENSIRNMIGTKNYQIHKFLLQKQFKDKNQFYAQDRLKYKSVIKVLQNKGLLHLRYKKPKNVQIEISTQNNPLLLMKIIKDVLANLGYAYYFTNNIEKKKENIIWKINFNSIAMLDPYLFLNELEKLNIITLNAEKINNTKWKYKIDLSYAKIPNTISISKNEKIFLQKPHKAYMLNVEEVTSLKVISKRLNHWYPRITFYDNKLNILGMFEKTTKYKILKIDIPKNTTYILIDDTFTLLNIKRGLTIIVR
jgi:hypothetical protein